MAPRELVEFSKTQCLLAVVFARQKVPSKAEEHFDKSLKLFCCWTAASSAAREGTIVNIMKMH